MAQQKIRLPRQTDPTAPGFTAASKATAMAPKRTPKARRTAGAAPAAAPSARPQPAEAEIERAVAALESEAVRRALSGVVVPVFHQGRECGSTVKHSDQLLMFLLKTLKPARYGGSKEPGAPQGAKIFTLDIDLSGNGERDGEDNDDEERDFYGG